MRTVFIISIFFLFLGQSTVKLNTDSVNKKAAIQKDTIQRKKPYPVIAKEKRDSITRLSNEIRSMNFTIRDEIKKIKDERRKEKENSSNFELLGNRLTIW